MKNENFVNIITRNNRGIALITVILIIAILSILAAVAIESAGTDIINAGSNLSTEQTLNISNSAMNIVLAQLGTGKGTNAGIGTPPVDGVYYYTLGDNNNNTIQNNTIQQSSTYIGLTATNINFYFSKNAFQEFPPPISGSFGFEYWGVYTPVINKCYFYNGQINTITQNQNASKTVQTGMTFSYGPFPATIGSKTCGVPSLTSTSWFRLP